MRRRFLQRKEPDRPATILFYYSECETIGISEDDDDDEHEEECPISEFRLNEAVIFSAEGATGLKPGA